MCSRTKLQWPYFGQCFCCVLQSVSMLMLFVSGKTGCWMNYQSSVTFPGQSDLMVEVLLYVHRNRRLIRDRSPGRPPRLSHSSWALYTMIWLKCCFTSTESVGLLGTGCPGCPPSLSHSSWPLIIFNVCKAIWSCTISASQFIEICILKCVY